MGDSAFIRRTRSWRAGCTQTCPSGSGGGGWTPLITRGWPPTSSQSVEREPEVQGAGQSVRCLALPEGAEAARGQERGDQEGVRGRVGTGTGHLAIRGADW
jgi:hypothetical protein